jgi:(E)-4-hydroxy-3-methylbut-2-enyl-diphosphate synthase
MNPEPRPFDMDTVVSEVEKRLAAYDDVIEVSVLGSAGRGIGEARRADFGITAAKDSGIVYAKGQPLKTVPTEELVEELFREIDKYYAAGKKLIVNDAQAAQAARWLSENEDETAI